MLAPMNATDSTPLPAAPGSASQEPSAPAAGAAAGPSENRAKQPRNPLHGITLETMVVSLADYFGWDELGRQIPIRCFQSDPSVGSSLKFLRKTPWAREKVESLYLFMLRDQKRNTHE